MPSESHTADDGRDSAEVGKPPVTEETGDVAPEDGRWAELFETRGLDVELKGRSVRGGAVTVGIQFAKLIVQTASTMILARLLSPSAYGLYAMVAVIIGFVQLFMDMGLSMATVQRPRITHNQVSALFWINVAVGTLLCLAMVAMAPFIAWFYHNEVRLIPLTMVVALSYVFGGLTVQHQALLRRQMRFTSLAVTEISALALANIVGVILAWVGMGYWALAFIPVCMTIFTAIGVWSLCPWRPGWPRRGAEIRSMLIFGGNMTGFNFMNYFARNFDNLLIGRVWGSDSLGLYNKAYQLMLLPLSQSAWPISRVAIPVLSRLQDDPPRYRKYYLEAITLIAFFIFPAAAFMVVMSDELILLFLGGQWVAAAPIFAVLGVSAAIQPIWASTGWIHVSVGRTDRMFKWGIVWSLGVVTAFMVGLPHGPIGVAICYTIATYLLLGPSISYAGRPIGLTFTALVIILWRAFIAALLAGGVCWFVCVRMNPEWFLLIRLALGFVVMSAAYLGGVIVLHGGARPIWRILALTREFRLKRKVPSGLNGHGDGEGDDAPSHTARDKELD